jgi:prepilin-type N-terminal cleavage/methylation domain-containing protein/prepilin-type processing-associated H-X9-DG protein
MKSSTNRRGLTLVEMLAVIAIIGLLMALLLPAVQSVRESSRRNACVNNLKQVGSAVQQFHSARNGFPPASTASFGLSFWAVILPYAGQEMLGARVDYGAGYYQYDWKLGVKRATTELATASRVNVDTLQGKFGTFGQRAPGYMTCPTRGEPGRLNYAGRPQGISTCDYGIVKVDGTRNASGVYTPSDHRLLCERGWSGPGPVPAAWSKFLSDHAALLATRNKQAIRHAQAPRYLNFVGITQNDGECHYYGWDRTATPPPLIGGEPGVYPLDRNWLNWAPGSSAASVLDGLSNTAIVCERHITRRELGSNLGYDGEAWGAGCGLCGGYNELSASVWGGVARGADEPRGSIGPVPGSWHPGACNFLMADGAVRTVDNAVSLNVLVMFAHASDGVTEGKIQILPWD